MAVLTRLLTVFFLFALTAVPARAATDLQLQEQEIKAGMLYNFLKYTQWPDDALAETPSSMVVCIYGRGSFSSHLRPMEGRTVNRRTIVVRQTDSLRETDGCHLVFVNEKMGWTSLSAYLANKSVLTVSDFDGFAQQGGMIQFGRKDNRINVNLNIDAMSAANLRVQDRLKRLVTIVRSSPKGG